MKKQGVCVEIDGIFYESMRYASRVIGCHDSTIKYRCLSNNFPNYKIVPFRITYTKKKCSVCGEIKLLKEFSKQSASRDGLRSECKKCAGEYNEKYTRRPEVKIKKNKKLRERRKTDIAFKLNLTMGSAVSKSLKGKKNGAHWESLVGYSCEELMAHLEKQFLPGMSWENYGKGKDKWHVDHKIPIDSFNITSNTCQEFLDCWALPNLQPLWQPDNQSKGAKLNWVK